MDNDPIEVLREAVTALKTMHGPFDHDYIKDEKCCDRCRLLARADDALASLSAPQAQPVEKHFLLTDYQINEASQQRKDGKWLTLERTVYAAPPAPDGVSVATVKEILAKYAGRTSSIYLHVSSALARAQRAGRQRWHEADGSERGERCGTCDGFGTAPPRPEMWDVRDGQGDLYARQPLEKAASIVMQHPDQDLRLSPAPRPEASAPDDPITSYYKDRNRAGWAAPRQPTAADEAQRCTCPSGDGSLRWPCPVHPPSAPVGVEDSLVQTALRNLPQYISKSGLVGPDKHSAMMCFETLRDALAQQPAARHPMDADYTPKAHRQQPAVEVKLYEGARGGGKAFKQPAAVDGACQHEWVSGDNKYVTNASVCLKCKTIMPTDALAGQQQGGLT